MVCFDSVKRRAMSICTRESLLISTSGGGAANCAAGPGTSCGGAAGWDAGAGGVGAGAACCCSSTSSISSRTMRPPGPVPRTWLRSMLCSSAIRRASGDALTNAPLSLFSTASWLPVVLSAWTGALAGASSTPVLSAAGAGAGCWATAPVPIRATAWPIGTVSPSCTRICCKVPAS